MDLSTFEISDDATFLQLTYPAGPRIGQPIFDQKKGEDGKDIDDESKPVGVMIVSSDSEAFKTHVRRVADRNLEMSRQRGGKPMTIAAIEEEAEKSIAACIQKLVNITWKGKELKAPEDNRRFLKLMPWASEQVDKGMSQRELFMKALRTN